MILVQNKSAPQHDRCRRRRFVASTIFNKCRTSNNGSFAIYIVPMRNPCWKMHLERDIPYPFMVVCLLSKERNKGCIVLLAIGYQPKMKSFGA
jgi:hypothetical protein